MEGVRFSEDWRWIRPAIRWDAHDESCGLPDATWWLVETGNGSTWAKRTAAWMGGGVAIEMCFPETCRHAGEEALQWT
ncbi:uncharacterized protein BO95DRAFT_445937 [Aspergillus brunneoviolaceus CBS 621.78]|uniref:Uncharacterized protein n=1 Tax=Aspergillus brunneoviolaceus CBS 621.78 TaxID=1450534 RepID=A0ACD1FZW2_9EURO|nr:hypothetical protein BO95DRAFT_445937 [Aspergillus brunneoviolaceus CBS 621.78]RAH42525.1 hypothetical protein BO95DRAFT_445937 [Aspergillus brunneoviolaceus CBS 621.78]